MRTNKVLSAVVGAVVMTASPVAADNSHSYGFFDNLGEEGSGVKMRYSSRHSDEQHLDKLDVSFVDGRKIEYWAAPVMDENGSVVLSPYVFSSNGMFEHVRKMNGKRQKNVVDSFECWMNLIETSRKISSAPAAEQRAIDVCAGLLPSVRR
jgi:hypothetical protein